LHEPSENAPKNPQRNDQNGKQENGRTVDEYAPRKNKPLNRPKTHENRTADQQPNRTQNERKKAEKRAETGKGQKHRHEAGATNRHAGRQAEQGRSTATEPSHEKKDSPKAVPKKRGVYAYPSPQSETLTSLGGMPYQVYSARMYLCAYAVIQ
jgi:hypothetical protein